MESLVTAKRQIDIWFAAQKYNATLPTYLPIHTKAFKGNCDLLCEGSFSHPLDFDFFLSLARAAISFM